MTTNISRYMRVYFLLYETMYNDNKHFLIHENVYRLIRDDV